ncbi:acyltransferase PGAP2-like [Oculina patagonica]
MVSDRLQTPQMSVRFERLALFVSSLPLLSFVSCVSIALVWHFDETTRTQCHVPNYLPSISAAVGEYMPEKFIWRIGIALHCLPRIFLFPFIIHKHYKETQLGRRYNLTTWWFGPLNLLNCILQVVENGGLLTLTYISSTDNADVHEAGFIVFMVCTMLYMFLSCILSWLTANKPMNTEDYTLFRKKIFIMFFNYFSFGFAMYFYFRHNWYCEPGMYTLFALAEYCTVVSIIVFHWHCWLPFHGAILSLAFIENNLSKIS